MCKVGKFIAEESYREFAEITLRDCEMADKTITIVFDFAISTVIGKSRNLRRFVLNEILNIYLNPPRVIPKLK